jgi:FtsP/CotA-like multicopper oxidase with cupredoxin domain
MYLIATDGGPIAEPFEMRELLLAPGERAEVLIRGERTPGQYRLMNLSIAVAAPGRRPSMGEKDTVMARHPEKRVGKKD